MTSTVDSGPEACADNDIDRAGVAQQRHGRAVVTTSGLPLASVVVFVGLWQVAASSGVWDQIVVPCPSSVWRASVELSTTHDGVRGYQGHLLREHLNMTLRRAVTGVADEAAFLRSRIVVLFRRPGRVVLDIPSTVWDTGGERDDIRGSAEFAALRSEISHAVKSAAV